MPMDEAEKRGKRSQGAGTDHVSILWRDLLDTGIKYDRGNVCFS